MGKVILITEISDTVTQAHHLAASLEAFKDNNAMHEGYCI